LLHHFRKTPSALTDREARPTAAARPRDDIRLGDRTLALSDPHTGEPKKIGPQGLDQYELTALKSIDAFAGRYAGRDLSSNQSVIVEEYVPAGLCRRAADGLTLQAISRRREKSYRLALERFQVEGEMLKRMDDPGVVRCLDTFLANGTCYRVFEDLTSVESQPCISLRALVRRDADCFNESLAQDILLHVLPVLGEVHATNALHRSITPDSILIGEDGRIVLNNFGAARYMIAEKSETLPSVLEPGYAPFEFMQRRDHQGPCSDLYSLGACIYFAMTGRDPVDAPARFDAVQNRDPDPLKPLVTTSRAQDTAKAEIGAGVESKFSRDLRACVDWMMSLRVQDRPRNAGEVMTRLGASADMPAVLVSVREDSDELLASAIAPESQSAAAIDKRRQAALGRRRLTTAAIAAGLAGLAIAAVILKPGGWEAIGTKPQVGSAAPAVSAAIASPKPMITRSDENVELIKSALSVQSSPTVAANINDARVAMLNHRLMETSGPSALGLLEKALNEQPDNPLAMEGINHLLHYFVNELQRAEAESESAGIRVSNRNLRRIRLRHPESQPVRSPGFYAPIMPADVANGSVGQIGPGQRDFVN